MTGPFEGLVAEPAPKPPVAELDVEPAAEDADYDAELDAISDDFISAVEAKDRAGVSAAFKAAVRACMDKE